MLRRSRTRRPGAGPTFKASGRNEVAAVNEHEAAVAEADRPPSRRIHDLLLTDLHAVPRAVAEILHDDSDPFTVSARVYAYRDADGDAAVFGAFSGRYRVRVNHRHERPPWRSVKHIVDREIRD
jgi:hypothetical protein